MLSGKFSPKCLPCRFLESSTVRTMSTNDGQHEKLRQVITYNPDMQLTSGTIAK